jgi:hypothetical protein
MLEAPAASRPGEAQAAAAKKPGTMKCLEQMRVRTSSRSWSPNPGTGARRIRKQLGRILEQAVDPNDGAILMNEKGMDIWRDITPPTKPGEGFVPMPMASSQPGAPMEQLGMQEVINNQQRVANGPLSDTIAAVLRG